MIKFGCYIYQDGKSYDDIASTTKECERLGFDSVWLKDNFIPWLQSYLKDRGNRTASTDKQGENEPMLECWTTLSSLAPITRRIRLGAILINSYRTPPSLLAKMISALDVISNGRLEVGLSAGWYKREFEAYGFNFQKGSARVAMLKESMKIIRMMLVEPFPVSFAGKYFTIDNATCNPKPVQKPCPPLWVGGGGERTIETAARYADGWNYGLCPYEEYLAKLSILKNHCKLVNRNYQSIMKGWHGLVVIGSDEEQVQRKMSDLKRRWGAADAADNNSLSSMVIAGTPKEVQLELAKYADIGANYFTPSFPDTESLEMFAERIIPQFRYP